jgi:hypothetical protein
VHNSLREFDDLFGLAHSSRPDVTPGEFADGGF